jgi:monovalent cation:H+ antiporter, CPA1 family
LFVQAAQIIFMEHGGIVTITFFVAVFLLGTAFLQKLVNKISFPYTVALLITGFIAQFVAKTFHFGNELTISPDFIFYILLPTLLFEASMHINIHQFKRQFKTISFLATFGLLVSIFVIAFGMSLLLQFPFEVALLFGAIISATDPIAVLALFKTLGAPKRLALIADGESMFNDATAVIAFRIVSTFAVADAAFTPTKLIPSIGNFFYVFVGSILGGLILGYIASRLIQRLKNERVLVMAVTSAIAIGSFAGAEHFFHFSGVIVTVMAGITIGNLARGKMTSTTIHSLEEYWEYLGFLALSLVFFFASFSLDLGLFGREIGLLLIVVFIVLFARAVSVYLTSFLSNSLSFFKDEPDIPMSWQHILNWGGLRGVIPLVLVYSLPDSYAYKELMLQLTFACLLFTLFVNGLTIKPLLLKLKLHIPGKEEQIIHDEELLFEVDSSREKLQQLPKREFDQKIVQDIDTELQEKQDAFKEHLLAITTPDEFHKSLKLESLAVERRTLQRLFDEGRCPEGVFYEFDSELDLQQDALEFPEVSKGRAIAPGGYVVTGKSLRKRILGIRKLLATQPMLCRISGITVEDIVRERYNLLRVRLFSSYAVLDYLDRVHKFLDKKILEHAVEDVRSMQKAYIEKNLTEVKEIEKEYPEIIIEYQKDVIQRLISSHVINE